MKLRIPTAARLWIALLCGLLATAATGSLGRSDLPRGAPGSRLSAAASATEYWDLLVELDSGHKVFARFSITNEGPGQETAYALGHVLTPEGRSYAFQNGRRKGRWSLAPDGLHVKIGSSELFLRDPERRLWIDKAEKGVELDLRFRPPSAGRPEDLAGPGYWVDLLHIAAPVEGSLWLPREMSAPMAVTGSIAATHTWMDETESELALRRIELFAQAPQTRLYLSNAFSPKGLTTQRLLLTQGGSVALESDRFEVGLDGRSASKIRKGYPIPSALQIRGDAFHGRVELGELLLQNDPMGLIPQPFRWFLSFKMKPHRVWLDSRFEVTLRADSDDSYREVRGRGVTAVSFLQPVELP